jgi:hypothetical protein
MIDREVWKQELHPGGWQEIESKPLFFGAQGEDLFVWYEHDPSRYPTDPVVLVRVYGTGRVIQHGAEHLMSCQQGPYVWHLYTIERSML